MNGPNKGPQGKLDYGTDSYMPEPQERYEEEGGKDIVTDIPSLDPLELKAPETDHTPNLGGPSKPDYGRQEGGL